MALDHWFLKNLPHRMIAIVLVLPALAGVTVCAQNYPDTPVRLVVCYAAGGNADLLSRIYAQKLSEALGQPFAVDNRGGAAGTSFWIDPKEHMFGIFFINILPPNTNAASQFQRMAYQALD